MVIYFLTLIFSVIVCVYAGYLLARRTGLFCIILFPVFSGFIQKGLSAAYLDTSHYATELYIVTWNVYAGPSYFIVTALLFWLTYVFVGRTRTVDAGHSLVQVAGDKRELLETALPLLGLGVAAYLILDMVLGGVPLLSGGVITRFNFWSDYSRLPLAGTVSNLATLVCLGLGALYASSSLSGRRGKQVLFVVALLLCVRFMLGYKVSGIIDIVLAFGSGYIFRRYTSMEVPSSSVNKTIKLMIGVVVAAIASYMIYQIASGTVGSVEAAWDSLLEREFSSSGHLWWAVFGDTSRSLSLLPSDISELMSVFELKSEFDTDIGVYGVMSEYALPEVVADYVQNGVRMGACAVTTSLFYNGILITLAILALNAFILSRFFAAFVKDAAANRILSMMVLWRVLQIFFSYLTAHGSLVGFYRPSVLFMLIAYAIIRMYENQVNSRLEKPTWRTGLRPDRRSEPLKAKGARGV